VETTVEDAATTKPYTLVPRFDDELDSWIVRARDGKEPEAAKALMARFVNAVEAGGPIDPHLLRYAAESFREVLDGDHIGIAQALGRSLGLVRAKAGNHGESVAGRILSRDAKEEIRQDVWKAYANGETQGRIMKDFSARPIVPMRPAQYISEDTIRDMLRAVGVALAKKNELLANGVDPHDVDGLVAREFNIEEGVCRWALIRRQRETATEKPSQPDSNN
jgi:hypothetical protein